MELKTGSVKNVYAMDSGTIKSITTTSDSKNTGQTVYIESSVDGEKYVHTYSNLKSISVKKGDRVYKGQKIATSKANYLYIALGYVNGSSIVGMLPSNFVGKDKSYAVGSLAQSCQTYSDNCGTSNSNNSSTIDDGEEETTDETTEETTEETTDEVTQEAVDDDTTDDSGSDSDSSDSDNSSDDSSDNSDQDDTDSTTATTTKATTTTVVGTCSINYESRLIGDINCDGKVSNADDALLYNYIRGRVKFSSSDTLKIADVDGNGRISISDVAYLHLFDLGKIKKICNSYGKCNTK